jgi:hypothetical protein
MRNTTFCFILVSLFIAALQMKSDIVSSFAVPEAIHQVNVQIFAGDPSLPIPNPPPLTLVDDTCAS